MTKVSEFDQRVAELLEEWESRYAADDAERQVAMDAARPDAERHVRDDILEEAVAVADAKKLRGDDLDAFVAEYIGSVDVAARTDGMLASRYPSTRASEDHDRAHAEQFVTERMAEEAAERDTD